MNLIIAMDANRASAYRNGAPFLRRFALLRSLCHSSEFLRDRTIILPRFMYLVLSVPNTNGVQRSDQETFRLDDVASLR